MIIYNIIREFIFLISSIISIIDIKINKIYNKKYLMNIFTDIIPLTNMF